MNSKLRVTARSASTAPATREGQRARARGAEAQRIDADRQERRVEVAPRDVRPVPRAGREHERREGDLRGERDGGGSGRRNKASHGHAHEDEADRDREHVRQPRQRDQRALGGEARDPVQHRSRRDVPGPDQVLGDRVGPTLGQHGAKRLEITRLVEVRLERVPAVAGDREERVEADPDEREVAVEPGDDPRPSRRRGLSGRVSHSAGAFRHRSSDIRPQANSDRGATADAPQPCRLTLSPERCPLEGAPQTRLRTCPSVVPTSGHVNPSNECTCGRPGELACPVRGHRSWPDRGASGCCATLQACAS